MDAIDASDARSSIDASDASDARSSIDASDARSSIDASDARSPIDAREAGNDACWFAPDASLYQEPNLPHIDCFGGVDCRDGVVHVSLFQPIFYCSQAQLDADLHRYPSVCDVHGLAIPCASGRCNAPTHRYAACRASVGGYAQRYDPAVVRAFCDGATVAAGARCAADADCRPAIDQPDYALRCDRETSMCVQVPRPPRPADFGQPCVGGLEGCATTEAACGGYRRTAVCSLDEDCPAGFDCAQLGNTRCTGVCVPRGSRSPSSLIPCAVFNSDADAGADAAVDAIDDGA